MIRITALLLSVLFASYFVDIIRAYGWHYILIVLLFSYSVTVASLMLAVKIVSKRDMIGHFKKYAAIFSFQIGLLAMMIVYTASLWL